MYCMFVWFSDMGSWLAAGGVKTGLNGLIMVRNPWIRIFTAKIRQNPPQQLEQLVLGRAQLELAPCVMRHEPHVCRYAAQAAARLRTSKLGQP